MAGGPQLRTYRRSEAVVFLKTKERWGGLSNMAAGYPLLVNGIRILTSEALYQACRFPHFPEVQKLIIAQRSPMAAKMLSKPYRRSGCRPDWDRVRVQIMRWCLRVKLAQHWDTFGRLLLETGDRPIVEESRRDTFWGARPIDVHLLQGRNILGRLLMELREELRGPDAERLRTVEPLAIPDFLLLGKPIEPVVARETSTRRELAKPRPLPLDLGTPSSRPTMDQLNEHSGEGKGRDTSVDVNATRTGTTGYKKKLIEVALPLEAINRESAREKSIRHGHPSTLHLWWARRPLAACRAVLWASLVDDPSAHPDRFPTEEAQEAERKRLFEILEDLVKWENSTNEDVLRRAREEILKSTDGNPPPVLDPFCGGGSIPLEAQRLGLEAHASDLNPVAVLITKALIEIPPKFADMPPVNPDASPLLSQGRTKASGSGSGGLRWKGAAGLAADVRYYGKWMRDEAKRRIGHLYPKVKLPPEHGGGEATVIAWLWARTVTCPNPACGAQMPLVRSFVLSTKKGRESWVEPVVDHASKTVRFDVRTGKGTPQEPPKIGRGAKFRCLVCGQIAEDQHIKDEGLARRMGAQLMAIVAEGQSGRIYLAPNGEHEAIAASAEPRWKPDGELAYDPRAIWCVGYGLTTFADLFTPRQLVALTTFSDLVGEARERVRRDAIAAGLPDDGVPLAEGGRGAQAYADAVATYLAFACDKGSDYWSTICIWHSGRDLVRNTFARQAIPMTWDYAEANPLSASAGSFAGAVEWVATALQFSPCRAAGYTYQRNASAATVDVEGPLISTDPPYYDNIGYADLSDFFYVWLRRSLSSVYPALFSTLLTPKAPELVATRYRFGGDKRKAEAFFEQGLGRAFDRMRQAQHPAYPLTVYYAFKQSETEGTAHGDGVTAASTGWETMLEGLLRAGFTINGTWPMRTELIGSLKKDVGALASSIVLVCRPRPEDAPVTTRTDFIRALRRELPDALRTLQHGNIAPVDLAQAAIGPGMAIFSRHSKVLEASGEPMTVRTALQLINQVLDEVLAEQEGEFDADTRWAVAWFEQFGMGEGPYGVAETLSKAKNTSVGGMVEAGILHAARGKVRLIGRNDLPRDWDPRADRRLTVWEVTQYLIRALKEEGEPGAATLARQVGGLADLARDLAYRLYTIAERKKWASDALDYNSLVTAWPEIQKLAAGIPTEQQARLM